MRDIIFICVKLREEKSIDVKKFINYFVYFILIVLEMSTAIIPSILANESQDNNGFFILNKLFSNKYFFIWLFLMIAYKVINVIIQKKQEAKEDDILDKSYKKNIIKLEKCATNQALKGNLNEAKDTVDFMVYLSQKKNEISIAQEDR